VGFQKHNVIVGEHRCLAPADRPGSNIESAFAGCMLSAREQP
jgi:hypothetical protein